MARVSWRMALRNEACMSSCFSAGRESGGRVEGPGSAGQVSPERDHCAAGLEKHMAIVGYLKSGQGMGHGHANATRRLEEDDHESAGAAASFSLGAGAWARCRSTYRRTGRRLRGVIPSWL